MNVFGYIQSAGIGRRRKRAHTAADSEFSRQVTFYRLTALVTQALCGLAVFSSTLNCFAGDEGANLYLFVTGYIHGSTDEDNGGLIHKEDKTAESAAGSSDGYLAFRELGKSPVAVHDLL